MSNKTCKNCKYYIPIEGSEFTIGNCGKSISLEFCWESGDVQNAISPGDFGGEYVHVSETFGCINFTEKDERGPEK